jgi:signal transduction histidine kinase
MPFIPDSTFGIFYALLCFGVAGLSFLRNNTHARIVSLVFIAHWFSMRTISVNWPDSAFAWMAHDAATVAALIACGWLRKSVLAFACAALFFVVMLFDQAWWLFSIGSFDANAAVAEAAGYLAFLLIAGASLGSDGANYWSSDSGRGLAFLGLEGRRTISGRSTLSGQALASTQNTQEKGRGA